MIVLLEKASSCRVAKSTSSKYRAPSHPLDRRPISHERQMNRRFKLYSNRRGYNLWVPGQEVTVDANVIAHTTTGPGHYLVFITDKRHFVIGADEFDADDDEGAVDTASALYGASAGAGFEIWKDGEMFTGQIGAWKQPNA
jgi:hypothetical protein